MADRCKPGTLRLPHGNVAGAVDPGRQRVDMLFVKEPHLSFPELAFTIVTRAMLGAGIALLLAERLTAEQRKAVGATLTVVGLVTTIPAVWAVCGRCE